MLLPWETGLSHRRTSFWPSSSRFSQGSKTMQSKQRKSSRNGRNLTQNHTDNATTIIANKVGSVPEYQTFALGVADRSALLHLATRLQLP